MVLFADVFSCDKVYKSCDYHTTHFFPLDDLDLRHFDPEFTREKISDTPSPPRNSIMSVSVQDDTFAGFSYIPDGTQIFD